MISKADFQLLPSVVTSISWYYMFMTVEAAKDRGDNETIHACELLIRVLMDRGLIPCMQRLEKESSVARKSFIAQEDISLQLVPPIAHHHHAV
jgi:hypothetical protein